MASDPNMYDFLLKSQIDHEVLMKYPPIWFCIIFLKLFTLKIYASDWVSNIKNPSEIGFDKPGQSEVWDLSNDCRRENMPISSEAGNRGKCQSVS